MIEALDGADLYRAVEQDMRSEYVVLREVEGVSEAQVNVRLGSEMEDGVDVEFAKALQDIGRLCHITVKEVEVWPPFEHPRVVPRAAVVQLIERDHIVRMRVLFNEMAYQPGCTMIVRPRTSLVTV